ncbi:CpaF family protein [Paenibacillus sp.]|uniref:CpaF family protein n=1 Tax=Paenibacillus sp. TaxID=58172 RepID=UPI002D6D3C32|nr:CpaF family protein [Paenibacillus sp.]HZG58202.1 CpaF family protein [Paenibacillus sp.]
MSLYKKLKQNKQQAGETGAQQETILLMQRIRSKLLMRSQRSVADETEHPTLRREVSEYLETLLGEEQRFLPKEEKEKLITQVVQDITGLGPIQPLLDDESVSEIMVNGPGQVYVERFGKLELSMHHFLNDQQVLHVIERIIAPLGRRIDESQPMVDARLPDGSRIHAIIPPLALNGPTLTIRKFRKDKLGVQELIQYGALSKEMALFLEQAVIHRMNILVAGGTGSGKTTLLNILSGFIPETERIVTIEDAAELRLRQPHVVSLETRPPNIEGRGEVTIRDLLRNSLRMRPDRIIIGEVRGGEALDMLQAMNTGHDGSLSTVHANTPRDVISRLETLMLMSGYDLPLKAIREQIASAIDLIVLQKRFRDGSRKITHITHVEGIENNTVVLQDLYVFEEIQPYGTAAVRGKFVQTGSVSFRDH